MRLDRGILLGTPRSEALPTPGTPGCGRLCVQVSCKHLGLGQGTSQDGRSTVASLWWVSVVSSVRVIGGLKTSGASPPPQRLTSCPPNGGCPAWLSRMKPSMPSMSPRVSFGALCRTRGPAAPPQALPILSQGRLPTKAFPHSWSVHSCFPLRSVAQALPPAGSSP